MRRYHKGLDKKKSKVYVKYELGEHQTINLHLINICGHCRSVVDGK